MLFIKKMEPVDAPVMEETTDVKFESTANYDVRELGFEIDMECAMFEFDCIHSTLEAYQATLEADEEIVDAEFREVKNLPAVGAPAKANGTPAEAKKSLWKRICEFVGNIIKRVGEMLNRFLNWFATKIKSNDKFIAEYKNKKLGEIEAEAYDYKACFDRVNAKYKDAQETFNIANKAVKDFIQNKDMKWDVGDAGIKVSEVAQELDSVVMNNMDKSKFKVFKAEYDHEKQVYADYKKALLGDKTKQTLKGDELLKILTANKDVNKTVQKISMKLMDALKFGWNSAKQAQNDEIILGTYFEVRRRCLMVVCNRCSKFSSMIVDAVQTLIISIRYHISQCAKAAEKEAA